MKIKKFHFTIDLHNLWTPPKHRVSLLLNHPPTFSYFIIPLPAPLPSHFIKTEIEKLCIEIILRRPLIIISLLNPFQLAVKSLECMKIARSCVTRNLHLMLKLRSSMSKIKNIFVDATRVILRDEFVYDFWRR